jgi:HEAT repeat protein
VDDKLQGAFDLLMTASSETPRELVSDALGVVYGYGVAIAGTDAWALLLAALSNQTVRHHVVRWVIPDRNATALESVLRQLSADKLDRIRQEQVWAGLIAAAGDTDSTDTRLLAIWCLTRLGGSAARRALIPMLADPSETVRRRASQALENTVSAEEIDLLASAIGVGGNCAVRALELLASVPDARVPILIAEAIDRNTGDARAGALYQASRLGLLECAARAVACLDDACVNVQFAAAECLGKVGADEHARPLIAWALGHTGNVADAAVTQMIDRHRNAVSEALVGSLADSAAERRRVAVKILGTAGAGAVGPLITALDDPEERVAGEAARALGRIGDARAIEPLAVALRRALASNQSTLRGRAADALEHLGGHDALHAALAISATEET